MIRADRLIWIRHLAPAAPACVATRDAWLGWLATADDALVLQDGQQPAFNRSVNFCVDCTKPHRADMTERGRCNPQALQLHPEATPA